ncbi:MAG: hypothetical protein ACR2G5_12420 [Pyrinomonadaceae bacterium]
MAAGGLLYTPVENRAGADTYGFAYSVVSKRVKACNSPSLQISGRYRSGQREIYGQQKIINYANREERVRLLLECNGLGCDFGKVVVI